MAKGKPTVADKRESARKLIQEVAMELFYTKGYESTTIRDIILKAGILNGSLYNRFKNKDDILFSIVKDGIQDLLSNTKAIMEEEKNILLAASFPGALQIYLASKSSNIAELLYHVHCMWPAVEEYVSMNIEWSRAFLSEFGIDSLDGEQLRLGILALIGVIGEIVGYYSHGGKNPCRDVIAYYVLLVATSIKMPVMNLDAVADRLVEILSADDFVFMGHRISEDLVQSSNVENES